MSPERGWEFHERSWETLIAGCGSSGCSTPVKVRSTAGQKCMVPPGRGRSCRARVVTSESTSPPPAESPATTIRSGGTPLSSIQT